MRKKVSIDRSIPRAPLPDELHPDWLSSAVVLTDSVGDGKAAERSSSITS
ncbi:hypothetical protein [Mesorhizobium sp. CAU 1732]